MLTFLAQVLLVVKLFTKIDDMVEKNVGGLGRKNSKFMFYTLRLGLIESI